MVFSKMNGKRRPNKAEQKWINAILEHGCIVCRNEMALYSPAEVHHTDGGSNHMATIGLCMYHHRSGLNDEKCTSRHPHKHDFEVRYGTDENLLNQLKLEIGDI